MPEIPLPCNTPCLSPPYTGPSLNYAIDYQFRKPTLMPTESLADTILQLNSIV